MKKSKIWKISAISVIISILIVLTSVLLFNKVGSKSTQKNIKSYEKQERVIKEEETVRYLAIGDSLSSPKNRRVAENNQNQINNNGRTLGVSYPDFVVNFLQLIERGKVSSFKNLSTPNTTIRDWNKLLENKGNSKLKQQRNLNSALMNNNEKNELPTNHEFINAIKNSNLLTISLGLFDLLKSWPVRETFKFIEKNRRNKIAIRNFFYDTMNSINKEITNNYINFVNKIREINTNININIISYPTPFLRYTKVLDKLFKSLLDIEEGYSLFFYGFNNALKNVAFETDSNYINIFNPDFWNNYLEILVQNHSLDLFPGFKGNKKIGQEIVAKLAMPEIFYQKKLSYKTRIKDSKDNIWEDYKKYNPFVTEGYYFNDIDTSFKQIYFPKDKEVLIKNIIYGITNVEQEHFLSNFENEVSFQKTALVSPSSLISLINFFKDLIEDNREETGSLDYISLTTSIVKGGLSLFLKEEQVRDIMELIAPMLLIKKEEILNLIDVIFNRNDLINTLLKDLENEISNIRDKDIATPFILSFLSSKTIYILIQNIAAIDEINPVVTTFLVQLMKTLLSGSFLSSILNKNKISVVIYKQISNILWGGQIGEGNSIEDFISEILNNHNLKESIKSSNNLAQLLNLVLTNNEENLVERILNLADEGLKNNINRLSLVKSIVGEISVNIKINKENSKKLEKFIDKLLLNIKSIGLFKDLIKNIIIEFTKEVRFSEIFDNKNVSFKLFLKMFNLEMPETYQNFFEIFNIPEIEADELADIFELAFQEQTGPTSEDLDFYGGKVISSSGINVTGIIDLVFAFSQININLIKSFNSFLKAFNTFKFKGNAKIKIRIFFKTIINRFIAKNVVIQNFIENNVAAFLHNWIINRFDKKIITLESLTNLIHEILIKEGILNDLILDFFEVLINTNNKMDNEKSYSAFYAVLIKELINFWKLKIPEVISKSAENEFVAKTFKELIERFIVNNEILKIIYENVDRKIVSRMSKNLVNTEIYKLIDKTIFKPFSEIDDNEFFSQKIINVLTKSINNLSKLLFEKIPLNLIIDFVFKNEDINIISILRNKNLVKNFNEKFKTYSIINQTKENITTNKNLTNKENIKKAIMDIIEYLKNNILISKKYNNKLKNILNTALDELFLPLMKNKYIPLILKKLSGNINESWINLIRRLIKLVISEENIKSLTWLLIDNLSATPLETENEAVLEKYFLSYIKNLSKSKGLENLIEKLSDAVSKDKELKALTENALKTVSGSWFIYDKNNLLETITNSIFGIRGKGVKEDLRHDNWLLLFVKRMFTDIDKTYSNYSDVDITDIKYLEKLNLDIKFKQFADLMITFIKKEVIKNHLSRFLSWFLLDNKTKNINSYYLMRYIYNNLN